MVSEERDGYSAALTSLGAACTDQFMASQHRTVFDFACEASQGLWEFGFWLRALRPGQGRIE